MVQVKVNPTSGSTMTRFVETTQQVIVQGIACRMFRFTQLGRPELQVSLRDGPAGHAHDAAIQAINAGQVRARIARHALTLRRETVDASGRTLQHRTETIPHRNCPDPCRSELQCRQFTHQFMRTRCTIWQLPPDDDAAQPGTPPFALTEAECAEVVEHQQLEVFHERQELYNYELSLSPGKWRASQSQQAAQRGWRDQVRHAPFRYCTQPGSLLPLP